MNFGSRIGVQVFRLLFMKEKTKQKQKPNNGVLNLDGGTSRHLPRMNNVVK